MRLLALLLTLLVSLCATASHAHLTPNSELVLDFSDGAVTMDVIVPEGDYYAAASAPADRSISAARAWLLRHVSATSADGRPWSIAIKSAEFAQIAGPPDLHAVLTMTPPAGADPRRLMLRWSAVIDHNPDHFALILIGNDHAGGIIRDDRRLIGAVRQDRQSISIDRGAPSRLAAFHAAFRLGVKHIAEGTDHLLFLLSLLLPAPLLAAGRTWGQPRPIKGALWKLAGTITAFTIGHSLTLIVAALGRWSLPAPPVEIAIALSILIAAIHAIRPIFAGREAWVAAGFGLIHGLAFATLIGDAGVGDSDRIVAIAGFNIGIEAVQLMVAALAMTPLLLIAPTPAYRWVRIGGGLFAAVAALGWIAERAAALPNPIASAMPMLASHVIWIWAALVMVAAIVRLPAARNWGMNHAESPGP